MIDIVVDHVEGLIYNFFAGGTNKTFGMKTALSGHGDRA
jgi:hypothetical protein